LLLLILHPPPPSLHGRGGGGGGARFLAFWLAAHIFEPTNFSPRFLAVMVTKKNTICLYRQNLIKLWIVRPKMVEYMYSHAHAKCIYWPSAGAIAAVLWKIQALKGQCHEIFDLWYFRQSITPRPQMNTLKYFRILFRIRWEINENVLIPRYAA
jgi:hypothetical protein